MDDRAYTGITMYQEEPTHPNPGDMLVGKSGDFLVWAGGEWQAMSIPIEDLAMAHINAFETQEEDILNKHSQLKELWNEYKVLRKLLTGE